MLDEIIKKACNEIYEEVYGEKLTDKKAEELVKRMKPYGEHWTLEEANKAVSGEYLPSSKYFTLNMMYNDYHDLFKDKTNDYIEISKLWLNDVDSDGGDIKTYRYATRV